MAIQGEKAAIILYSKAEMATGRPRNKTLFKQLTAMEKGHLAVLTKRFDLQPDMPTEEEFENFDIKLDTMEDELDVLVFAMGEEIKARNLYREGKQNSNDRKTRKIFEQLIADEEYHHDLLKGIYVQLTGREPEEKHVDTPGISGTD